jgi:PAS domain S-box-containing protein
MARAVADLDWTNTSLGPLDAWSSPLRIAASMVLRSTLAMALLWGEDGIMVYNDAYARAAGLKGETALGRSVYVVWPEVSEFIRDVMHKVMAGAAVSFVDRELTLSRGAGEARAFFNLDFSPVMEESGRPVGVLAVVVETTTRKLLDQSLDHQRQRFVELFEQSPAFVAVLRGPEHRFELTNPGYLQLVGHREVIGKTVAEALPEAAAQGYLALLDQVYQSGKAFEGRKSKILLHPVKGGPASERYLDFVYQPIRDSEGQVSGIFVEGVDVTERVHGSLALRQEEDRSRQILDSAMDFAIIATNLAGKITRWNKGAEKVLGWTEEEMLGQDASRFFTPEDVAAGRIDEEMQDALTRAVGSDERWHVRRSGERFWASGEMTVLRDDAGEAAGFVKVLRDRTAEHRAGEALRESEQRLRRAQGAGGVGTFSIDVATDTLDATQEFFRIYGLSYTPGRVPADIIEKLVIDADRHLVSSTADRKNNDIKLDVEYRIKRASDGKLRWIARRAEIERNADGSIARMVGVAQDISDRKATLEAAAESAAQFQTLAQQAPNHVWTARADGYIDWYNERVYEYTGASPGELDGAAWATAIHPEDEALARARWSASLATGEPYEIEARLRRADGVYRWHLVRALAVRNADGQVVRWIGTDADIHETKRAQAESARDRNRIWSLSQEIMMVCDFNGRVTDINPSALKTLGREPEEIIGYTLNKFLHPDDIDRTAREVGKLSEGATTFAFENRWRHRDGSYRLLAWTAVPEDGFIHAIARDITRERSTEEALRQSQKLDAIGQLTGGVAHDFNNVLAVISNSVEVLKRLDPADGRRPRFIEAIASSVARASKLTGQLLAFARRQALQPMIFDAGANTRAVIEMIQSLAGVRIEVELNLSEVPCYINADPSQFDTALVNLAVNARDAMSEQGRLTIDVFDTAEIPAMPLHPGQQGDFVAISITDTGTGIAPEHLSQIFEPFFTTKAIGVGTGLGLSQVFGFAKQSGGDIRVKSTLGKGSTFTLYLPRAQQPSEVSGSATAEASKRIEGSGCILVVEDNPEVAASVRETLEVIGYTTVVMTSAERALAQLRRDASRFVAVFSDVVMTGMSGIELASEVGRIYGTLPVVLTSGYSYVLAQEADHGFTLLPKPYSVEELARVLQSVIHENAAGYRPRRSSAVSQTMQDADWERGRLQELAALKVMDVPADEALEEITRLAARYCDAPIALISLVDDKRQWFKAKVGLEVTETPKEVAFCAHAIRTPDMLTVVPDATRDPRFSANPLVTGDPNIRFYAGAPLVTSSGHALGTLCVVDKVPRDLDAKKLEVLQFLAGEVVKRFEAGRPDETSET